MTPTRPINPPAVPLQSLLVGAHFRPPAKQLLAALPAACQLMLIPEPDNPYDASAVRVVLPLSILPLAEDPLHSGLNHALEGTGLTVDDLLAAGEDIHLGYLPAEHNKQLAQAQANGLPVLGNYAIAEALGNREPPWQAQLAFTPEGSPMVKCQTPDSAPGRKATSEDIAL